MIIAFVNNAPQIFDWLWLVWGVLFCMIEGTALYLSRGKPANNISGGTLSELVWRNIRGYSTTHRIMRVGLLILLVALISHFLLGTPLV